MHVARRREALLRKWSKDRDVLRLRGPVSQRRGLRPDPIDFAREILRDHCQVLGGRHIKRDVSLRRWLKDGISWSSASVASTGVATWWARMSNNPEDGRERVHLMFINKPNAVIRTTQISMEHWGVTPSNRQVVLVLHLERFPQIRDGFLPHLLLRPPRSPCHPSAWC